MSGLIDALLGGIAGGAGFEAEQAKERLKASREEDITNFKALLLDKLEQQKETRQWERENDPKAFKNRMAQAEADDRARRTGLLGDQIRQGDAELDMKRQKLESELPSDGERALDEMKSFAMMAKANKVYRSKDKDGNWITRDASPAEIANARKALQSGDMKHLRGDPATTQLFNGWKLFESLGDDKGNKIGGTLEQMTQSLMRNNPGMTKQEASKRAQQLYMRGNPIMDMDAGTP